MQEGSFSFRTKERFSSLTKQEKHAVEFIQANQDAIIHLSITDLALQSNVSESTITRLCVKLGYNGFQSMKINIAQEVVSSQAKIHEDLSPSDDIGMVIEKVFGSAVQAITMTKSILDSAEMEKSINVLAAARRIIVIGSGNSGSIAMDAQHKLLRIGLDAHAYTDGHMQLIAVSSLGEKDVVIGISHSGSSIAIRQGLEAAKEQGASTISITSYGVSPVSQVADIRLYTSAEEVKYRTYAISSRLAALAIMDSLYTGLSLRLGDSAVQNFEKLEKALTVKKY